MRLALNVVFSTFWLLKKSTIGGPLMDIDPPRIPLTSPTGMLAIFTFDISFFSPIMDAAVNRTVTAPMPSLIICESMDTRKYVPSIIPIMPAMTSGMISRYFTCFLAS